LDKIEGIVLEKKLVVPGDFLTVEEEFASGKNTFDDEDGNIFSAQTGTLEFNELEREVRVEEKTRKIQVLDRGSIIFGSIARVKDSFAFVNILSAEKDGVERIPLMNSAALRVSDVARGFVKDLKEEFKIGDIIKAKVSNISKHSIDLTTVFPELGVVIAYCVNCRKPLHLAGTQLKCIFCGGNERRKISNDYLIK